MTFPCIVPTMLLNTTKYDGSLHYRFMTQTVYEDSDTLAVYRGADEEIHSYRGSFTADNHMLNIFFATRYHNIVIMWNRDWTPHMHYVNIATPATWNESRVTAVDMDLDIIRRAGEERVILDDEDEFEHHTGVMEYPEELVDRCLREAEAIRRRVIHRQGIFDNRVFQWRPDQELPSALIKG